jgi:cytoskeletal protein RodZ
MEKNKNVWIGVVVVAVIIVGLIIWSKNKNSAEPVVNDTNSDQAIESTEDTTAGSVNVGAPAASINYQSALIKYKDARIQLDKTCQASPDKQTFKNGTTIMIR